MNAYPVVEFEAIIEEGGAIQIPNELQRALKPGVGVIVRVVEGQITEMLRSRGVTEQEIESISVAQMEVRGDVVRFLESEGALSSNRHFAQRVTSLFKQ